jgi:hypothetical protein
MDDKAPSRPHAAGARPCGRAADFARSRAPWHEGVVIADSTYRRWLGSLVVLVAVALGCEASGAAPAPSTSGATSAARPAPAASSSAPSSFAPPEPAARASGAATPAPATSGAAAADPLDMPALRDGSGKPLGQTEDRPKRDSPAFRRRLELLWQAIVTDDPTVAERVFFPVIAYEQVKGIEKPAADWKHRLWKNFARDVHEYHKKLGSDSKAARFIGLDLNEDRVKWMKPGEEGNKLGYHRVTRSKIRYADAAGEARTLELTSLISWRGEWFVVHLHGFK